MGTDNDPQLGYDRQASRTGTETNVAANVRETAGAASWWTLIALLLGVGASLAGTYIGASPLGPKANDRAHSPNTR